MSSSPPCSCRCLELSGGVPEVECSGVRRKGVGGLEGGEMRRCGR